MSGHRRNKTSKYIMPVIVLILCIIGGFKAITEPGMIPNINNKVTASDNSDLLKLKYNGDIAVVINDNKPGFSDEEKKEAGECVFEDYSPLDHLGRCGIARATICRETMPDPAQKRTSLGSVTPSGWQKINFWSRCHLIGYQLAGENANERNLITGCNRMNTTGMIPFENEVREYIDKNPDNRVLYAVEPVFDGENLVASGVHMRAISIEDDGSGVSFNVYVFNYEPGHIINYADGTVTDDPAHRTTVVLADKEAEWTGDEIRVDKAEVKGSTGKIRYIYYTEPECHQRTGEQDGAKYNGGAPTKRGQYYAKAVVSGDNWYPTAASNTASLRIL